MQIDVDKVVAVLLMDGNWYPCQAGSFRTTQYQFVRRGDEGRPEEVQVGHSSAGTAFHFLHSGRDTKRLISGPIDDVIAVEHS